MVSVTAGRKMGRMPPHDFEVIGPVVVPSGESGLEGVLWQAFLYCFPQGQYSVLVLGDSRGQSSTFVRVSSMCIWGHLFGSQLCDCGWQWHEAQRRIAGEGRGVLVFCHDQHGKGVGLRNHYRIYSEGQKAGLDLVVGAYAHLGFKEDYREYGDVARILAHLGVVNVQLLTNSPRRVSALRSCGFEVERRPIEMPVDEFNASELGVKKWSLHHALRLFDKSGKTVARAEVERRSKDLARLLRRSGGKGGSR